MSSDYDELLVSLSARHYLFTLFQSIFGNEPSDEQFSAMDLELTAQAFEIIFDDCKDTQVFMDMVAAYKSDQADLKFEYTRLFIGPTELPASPWESVYTSKDKLLFQLSTLKIRDFYRSQGFIPKHYPHVADDHLAIELDFLAKLGGRALEMVESNNTEGAKEVLSASLEFLNDHLLVWIDLFVQNLQKSHEESFYCVAAVLLAKFVKKDAVLVEEIINHI